jgi:hypothetical protein
MFKLIGIIVAALPVILFLKSMFGGTIKRSQAFANFKKHLDFAVWAILFCIGCAVVYAVGKLIYDFW